MRQDKMTLNRLGLLVTPTKVGNQCKEPGHTHYRYHIAATCSPKLDESGFVIDHNVIEGAIQQDFKERLDSCEKLVLNFAEVVERVLKNHGVKLYKLYVKVQPVLPVVSEGYAYMELERTY